LRRPRQEDHDAPGLPELRPDDRAPVRRAPRGPRERPERADRAERVGRVHPALLPGAPHRRGAGRRPRRHRPVGAGHLRAAGAGMNEGWVGRSADYKAAFLGTLGANAEFYAPYQDNARRWYRYSQERVPFINHAIIHPPVDRNIAPGAPGGPTDIYARVTKETAGGIYVSGAKVVATGSALTHFTFVAHHGLIPVQGKNFAVVFMVPTGAKGVQLICRVSNEMRAAMLGSPFDYPLSSRLDENDAIFVMDDVFVPWEDVFVYADVEKANNFFPRTGFLPRALIHG